MHKKRDGDAQYRLSHSYNISETDIQQTYLPPFSAAVGEAEVMSIMCAFDGQNTDDDKFG